MDQNLYLEPSVRPCTSFFSLPSKVTVNIGRNVCVWCESKTFIETTIAAAHNWLLLLLLYLLVSVCLSSDAVCCCFGAFFLLSSRPSILARDLSNFHLLYGSTPSGSLSTNTHHTFHHREHDRISPLNSRNRTCFSSSCAACVSNFSRFCCFPSIRGFSSHSCSLSRVIVVRKKHSWHNHSNSFLLLLLLFSHHLILTTFPVLMREQRTYIKLCSNRNRVWMTRTSLFNR